MVEKEKRTEVIFFRETSTSVVRVRRIAQRLGLEKADVCRRALREGLKAFEGIKLPGSEEPKPDYQETTQK